MLSGTSRSRFNYKFRQTDRGKDLRASLIDAFQRSNWAPGDLAVAANDAGILPKIFKRPHRTATGEDYTKKMLQDLSQRNDPDLLKMADHHLRELALGRLQSIPLKVAR